MIHTQVQPSASTEKSRMTWHYLDSNFKVRYLLRDNTEKYILSFSPPFFKRGFHFWNSFPMHPTTFPLNLLNTFCSEKQMAKKKKKKKNPTKFSARISLLRFGIFHTFIPLFLQRRFQMFALPRVLLPIIQRFKVDKSFWYRGDFVPRHKSISSIKECHDSFPHFRCSWTRSSWVKKSNQNGAQNVRRKRVWELARWIT